MVTVTERPLEPGMIFEKLRKENTGSLIFHYAVVKGIEGEKQTSGIRFERSGDIESELSEIEEDIKARWNISDILLIRRVGMLKVGELISLVAVSATASSDAFEACHHGLDRIRKMASLKKTELYID